MEEHKTHNTDSASLAWAFQSFYPQRSVQTSDYISPTSAIHKHTGQLCTHLCNEWTPSPYQFSKVPRNINSMVHGQAVTLRDQESLGALSQVPLGSVTGHDRARWRPYKEAAGKMKPGRRAGPVTGEWEEQALSEMPLGVSSCFQTLFCNFPSENQKGFCCWDYPHSGDTDIFWPNHLYVRCCSGGYTYM